MKRNALHFGLGSAVLVGSSSIRTRYAYVVALIMLKDGGSSPIQAVGAYRNVELSSKKCVLTAGAGNCPSGSPALLIFIALILLIVELFGKRLTRTFNFLRFRESLSCESLKIKELAVIQIKVQACMFQGKIPWLKIWQSSHPAFEITLSNILI